MTALYELANEIQKLELACEQAEEREENLDEFIARLHALEMEGDTKAANIIAWIISLEVEAEGVAKEIARLQARKRAREHKADSLREYLREWLSSTGRTKFKSEIATAYVTAPKDRVQTDTRAISEWEPKVLGYARDIGAVVTTTEIKVTKLKDVPGWQELPGVVVVTGQPTLTIR